ncbi:MAG: M24 family metallopeptidase, partial [Candidatus Thorarchaeota archaeon]
MQFTPQRVDKVHRAMQREDVDLLLITRAQDVQYLTGYQAPKYYLPTACVISQGQTPQLLISDLQQEFLGQDSVMSEVHPFINEDMDAWHPTHSSSFWNHIIEKLLESGRQSGMIGLQQDWLPVKDFDRLKNALPNAGFKDFSPILWRLRQIKDPVEIDMITQAVKIAEIGIMTALEMVSTEKTEADVSIEVESAMRNAGGHLRGIRAAVMSGANARFPFAYPSPQRIRDDEPVVIDITVSHGGYFAEVARTIHLGSPTKRHRELFDTNLQIAEILQKNIVPGITIDDLVKKVVSSVGKRYADCGIIQPLGSSIGLDLR